MTTQAPWSLDALRDLYGHMEWADGEIWIAASQLADRPLDGRLRDVLLHLHVVQRAFLNIWTGRPLVFPEPSSFRSLAELHEWTVPYSADLALFLDSVPPERLVEPLAMPWVREFEERIGRPFQSPTIGETMFQVTSHSTYHRGQANARLRELGVEPPLVDYIAWIWFGRPVHNKTGASSV